MTEQLTADEELALLTAMSKTVGDAIKGAKADAQEALMDAFSADGTDRRAIMVGGAKVGEVGVSFTKPGPAVKPGREREALEAAIELGIIDWSKVSAAFVRGWESRFSQVGGAVVEAQSAELCDWLAWEPSRPKSASVRGCKPGDVVPALKAKLGDDGLSSLLLGGAE